MRLPALFVCHSVNAICLTLINERILMTFPYPWCTALFQCAASVPFILILDLLPRRSKPTRSANPIDVFVLSSLFMLCSSSSLQGLRHEVLPIVIVGKSLAPISCILLEHIVLQMPLSAPSIAALAVMAVGACGGALCAFTAGGASAASIASGGGAGPDAGHPIFVAVMNSALMACMSVCEKRTVMLREPPSSLGLCLYRNALAAPLLALPVLAGIERPEAIWATVLELDGLTWLLLLLSACCSAIAGLLIFELQRLVSATTTQVANLCYTFATAVLGGAVFHSAQGVGDYRALLGFALSAASVCLYAAPGATGSLKFDKSATVADVGGKFADTAEAGEKEKKAAGDALTAGPSTSYGVKVTALLVLTFQNSSAPLLMRQSRSASAVAWIAQTGVIMQEVVKGLVSLVLIVVNGDRLSAVVESRQELMRASIPALLYLLQNNLQYIAVTYLDAATYTVTYQLKILSTALMSVLILKKKLDLEKWAGLIVLVAGVVMVQISCAVPREKGENAEGAANETSRQLLGLIAVLSACLLSGLAGVYTEKILKGSTISLWVRNAQLALCSLVIGSVGLLISGDWRRVWNDGFFVGYNAWTVASVVNNSFGGLLIAVVIKYADNILKNFSTAISIVFTTWISANFMGLQAGWMFIGGVLAVCGSTFLYGGACRCQTVSVWRLKIEEATRCVTGGSSTSEWGVKGTALLVLSFQNSAAPLLMRKSRSSSTVPWIGQTGVIMQELLKGCISLVLILSSGERLGSIFENKNELLRTSIPALLYLLQNNLQYVGVTYLDAATYTVTYQLKILSTAVLSVLMLQRKLSLRQWLALLVLVAGVATVQVSASDRHSSGTGAKAVAQEAADSSRRVLGLAAVLAATLLSGLAGVYTEKILKGSSVSLWTRNAQLSLCSLVIGIGGLAVSGDSARVQADGFFVGYNAWTIASVVNNGLGGLLIAVVIKYADNILKNFSTSISIILTTIISANFMGLQANSLFIGGVLLVCYSTFLYAGITGYNTLLPLLERGFCCLGKHAMKDPCAP